MTTDKLVARAEDQPWKSRLYVSEQAWKLFTTYQGVLLVLLLRLKQLETGMRKDFTKVEESIAEVKAALPHYTKFLDDNGADVLPLLVEDLGAAFERELLALLKHEPLGARDVQEAGALMAVAEKFIADQKANLETATDQSSKTVRQP